jgi:hypothetical protein
MQSECGFRNLTQINYTGSKNLENVCEVYSRLLHNAEEC